MGINSTLIAQALDMINFPKRPFKIANYAIVAIPIFAAGHVFDFFCLNNENGQHRSHQKKLFSDLGATKVDEAL